MVCEAIAPNGTAKKELAWLTQSWGHWENWSSGAGANPLKVEVAYLIHEVTGAPLPDDQGREPRPTSERLKPPLLAL